MNILLLPFRMVILIVTAIVGAFVGGIISALRLLIKCSFIGSTILYNVCLYII